MDILFRIGKQLFSNFYIGSTACFLIWITFFDGNDIIGLAENHIELLKTQNEIEFYQKKIDQVVAESEYLNGSDAAREKFAREKYLMRKENEEVFLVELPTNSSILGRLSGQ